MDITACKGLTLAEKMPSPPSCMYRMPAPKPLRDMDTLGKMPRSLSQTAPVPMLPLMADKASAPVTNRPVILVYSGFFEMLMTVPWKSSAMPFWFR